MSVRTSMWLMLTVELCVLHIGWMGVAQKETTTHNIDGLTVIQENLRLLKKDCGPYGQFVYCPRNPTCFQHGNGMWDISRRPTHTCDPRNTTHYGCHCRWSIYVDKTCTEVPCFLLMRRYFQRMETEQNQAYN